MTQRVLIIKVVDLKHNSDKHAGRELQKELMRLIIRGNRVISVCMVDKYVENTGSLYGTRYKEFLVVLDEDGGEEEENG